MVSDLDQIATCSCPRLVVATAWLALELCWPDRVVSIWIDAMALCERWIDPDQVGRHARRVRGEVGSLARQAVTAEGVQLGQTEPIQRSLMDSLAEDGLTANFDPPFFIGGTGAARCTVSDIDDTKAQWMTDRIGEPLQTGCSLVAVLS